jgi:hypothetical protein
MLLLLAFAAHADPLDVPVPSPCSQESDTDGDGRIDFVQTYRYDADRVLAEIRTDDDGDGVPDAIVRYRHDAEGRPTRSLHDWDANGTVDSVKDCSKTYCSTNWIPVCPAGMDCDRNELGLITTMRRGSMAVTNTYACWARVDGLWAYRE